MADQLVDDRAAYQEAMRRAEVASGIERDAEGNETNGIEAIVKGETPVATPELEGAVPVQASDQPLTPEPAEEADTSVAVELSVDELKVQLAEAEARIEEQKTMIGRQSAEVGDTRQQIADLQAQITAVQQTQATTYEPVQTVQITQELIDSRPDLAVEAAFSQRNEQALRVAFEAWKDIDPFTAATWLADRKMDQLKQTFEAQSAETNKRIETATAPLAQSLDQQEWTKAFNEVKATRPDFMDNAVRLLEEVAPQYPDLARVLSTGDKDAKVQALSALYALDKMGNPQAVQAQLAEAAQEAEADAAAARASAGVVNGQTTAGQDAVLKTAEELEQESYISRQKGKPSLARGWTGR